MVGPYDHWACRDLEQIQLLDGFKFIVHSDRPCHLWLRWTTTPPRRHEKPIFRRGVYFRGDIRFCFVTFTDNEQEEEGDTYIHTFHKHDWPICETRYFYFHGTINGIASPSVSPIFNKHFLAPVVPKPLAGYRDWNGGAATQITRVPDQLRGIGFSLDKDSDIYSVILYHLQYDPPPQDDAGTALISIREVGYDYMPIGSDLASKLVACKDCPLIANYWYGNPVYEALVTFDTPVHLAAGNYALLIDTIIGDDYGNDRTTWWLMWTARGWTPYKTITAISKNHRYELISNDGGSSWYENPAFKMMFEVLGTESL